MSLSNESTWRPNAFRRTVMSIPPKRLLALDPVLDPVGQHDHPGAGAERGHARAEPLAQRLHQVEDHRELPHRGGLAAGDHQPGHVVELCGPGAPAPGGRPPRAAPQVLSDVSLQREHADRRPPNACQPTTRVGLPAVERAGEVGGGLGGPGGRTPGQHSHENHSRRLIGL